jgi:murein DD-endopeptidase MepM/ murein hydrolase activator NlpD
MQEIGFVFSGPGGEKSLIRKIEVREKDYPAQHLKLPEKMVSFEEKTLNRIYKEKGVIRSALSLLTQKRYWSGEFVFPVQGKVLSEFGLRRFMNGKPRSPHRGVDFRAGEGTPIKACNAGEVVLTGRFFFGGNTVVLDHGQGILSLYMHLSEISVNQGEMVDKGAVIGLAGSTGRATGPHLHFALSAWGSMVNPLSLLKNRD